MIQRYILYLGMLVLSAIHWNKDKDAIKNNSIKIKHFNSAREAKNA